MAYELVTVYTSNMHFEMWFLTQKYVCFFSVIATTQPAGKVKNL